jgi:hypothetical protein
MFGAPFFRNFATDVELSATNLTAHRAGCYRGRLGAIRLLGSGALGDHLAACRGSFLVADAQREMTEQQLAEQSTWLRQEHDRYLAEPPDGEPYGNRYAAYRMTVTASAVWAEARRRSSERT